MSLQTVSREPSTHTYPSRPPLRVLVLHQHYWPETAATAQILADLCEDLVRYGHQVTVLCGQPSYRAGDRELSLPGSEIRRGVQVRRLWSYKPQKRTIPGRLAHYATYFASSFIEAATSSSFDVCLVMSTPPLLLGVTGTLLRSLKGIPFVYSVQDLYPDVAVHLGVIRAGGPVALASEFVASACYRSAGAIVTLSQGMATRLKQKGVAEHRVHVVANWADTSTLVPMDRDNDFSREHGLNEHFVVLYSGNLGLSQGLEAVLGAASLLDGLPIRFVFAGDGNAKQSLQNQATDKDLRNVQFIPPQPRERLSELLASCDLGLVTSIRSTSGDLVPSKLYGIMAASRPVMAAVDASSEVARVVALHQCGWLTEPESAEALAASIRDAFSASRAEREELGRRGRQASSTVYAKEVSTRRYADILESVAAPGEAHASL